VTSHRPSAHFRSTCSSTRACRASHCFDESCRELPRSTPARQLLPFVGTGCWNYWVVIEERRTPFADTSWSCPSLSRWRYSASRSPETSRIKARSLSQAAFGSAGSLVAEQELGHWAPFASVPHSSCVRRRSPGPHSLRSAGFGEMAAVVRGGAGRAGVRCCLHCSRSSRSRAIWRTTRSPRRWSR
jgi:hypothetical protein